MIAEAFAYAMGVTALIGVAAASAEAFSTVYDPTSWLRIRGSPLASTCARQASASCIGR